VEDNICIVCGQRATTDIHVIHQLSQSKNADIVATRKQTTPVKKFPRFD
jgi:hypothetical protein